MELFEWLFVGIVFFLTSFLTWNSRRYALAHGLLDIPNVRSSHVEVTPRGGGIAIVLVCTASFLILWLTGRVDDSLSFALILGGGGVAVIGFVDDLRQLSARIRLMVHLGAAVCAMTALYGPAIVQVGHTLIPLGNTGYVIGVLALGWSINLFNFMDGTDGLAASEGVFVALGGALLVALRMQPSPVSICGIVVSASCAGFLLWNWPPARIFMGDVGSGYLGYVVSVLALADSRDSGIAVWVWLILGGTFFVDSSVTLIRRLIRRERLHEAHRTHAYQWLFRRWGSHRRVFFVGLIVNVFWLFPLAWFAMRNPHLAFAIAVVALIPLVTGALMAGAGSPEVGPEKSLR